MVQTKKCQVFFSAVKSFLSPRHQAVRKAADHETEEQYALVLINQGRLQEAEAIYRGLIASGTSNHKVYGNLAAICGMSSRAHEMLDLLRKALELKPDFADAHNNLGYALKELGDFKAAIASCNKALDLKPHYPEAQNNLGAALYELGDIREAINSLKKAIELNPCYPEAYNNLGNALQAQGSLSAAIASYNKALELNPNYPEAHWNSSLAMLLAGNYKNGWQKYEWRDKRNSEVSMPHAKPACSLWDGSSLGPNDRILLVSEQGLGDTLQFMRYALVLKEQGASVSVCAQPKLHTLIQASGIDHSPLTPQQANKISEGKWIPLLSVARYLQVSPNNPVVVRPYIKTAKALKVKWESILSTTRKPIIGLNWQGNPETEKAGLRGRSLRLEAFSRIATNDSIALLSLQKGFGSEQLEKCSFRDCFVGCQQQINESWDFLETAAIIANCDLIITSDTSVAHLAAGMGKVTWLLLHKVPDWRWGLEGDTSFWYPSMRLFRQRESGNWDDVLQRVEEALRKRFLGTVVTDNYGN